MKIFQAEAALVFFINLILFHQCFCDEVLNASSASNWSCTCFPARDSNNVSASNCFSSCDCKLELKLSPKLLSKQGHFFKTLVLLRFSKRLSIKTLNFFFAISSRKADGAQWRCVCPANSFPKVDISRSNATCFAACKCTAGPLFDETKSMKKRVSRRTAVLVLLFCVVVTTLMLLATVVCYIYRRNKFSMKMPLVSSDKESSWNSSANLISRKTSVSETNTDNSSITGCFQKASFFCRTKTETIHGTIIRFSYSELEQATENFSDSNLIGIGGSSSVYRGRIGDGKTVAIKRLTARETPDSDSVFSTEVELISRLHHHNVVPFLGYCWESKGKKNAERLLVFELMPNGNLRDCLDDDNNSIIMSWDVRVSVAIGAARGLEYLHEAAAPRILHRDVKSTNILLDQNWKAKITDLGMAQCLQPDGLPIGSSSPAMLGTFGYFAPEYAIIGRASLMSDVFSFGVVLLELITGRQPIHKSTGKGEESLVIWATPRLQDSRRVITELPDPRLEGKFPEEEMQVMAYLAKECLLLDPDARPTMSEVVQILSTIAPDKSRRRNIPAGLFRMSADQRIRKESRPTVKDSNTLSPEYMESLILLSSNAKFRQDHDEDVVKYDEEVVDLTEPRFESFCVANVKSSTHERSL